VTFRFARSVASCLVVLLLVFAAHASAQDTTSATGDTGTSRAGKLTKAPELTNFKEVEAPYPESERASGRAVSVVLQLALTELGDVSEVVLMESGGKAFDDAAIDSAKRFKFIPAEIDGRRAPVKLTYRYDFQIKTEIVNLGPQVNYSGIILDASAPRKRPRALEGVKVTITREEDDPATGQKRSVTVAEEESDDEGYFEFEELPAGTYNITISGDEVATVSTQESIEPGKGLDVTYRVDPKDLGGDVEEITIEVIAPRIQKQATTVAIKTEEARRVPGAGGEALRVVQNLPGVGRAAFGSGALVVWGAAPQDTRVYMDGVYIPQLYHTGGFRATVNSDLVRSIDLSPGGYGAEYGRGLGGLVTVDSRALRADGFHGYTQVDVIDASALVETPINAKTRIALAGRHSHLSNTLSIFTSKDVSEYVPIPDFWDIQLKLERDLGENETISAMGITSNDRLKRTVTNPDPEQTISDERTTVFHRLFVTYRKAFSDGSSVTVTPSIGFDRFGYTQRFGSTPSEQQIDSLVLGLRAKWRGKLAEHISLNTGLDLAATSSNIWRRGALTLPPREGDITVFGQPPNDVINYDKWNVVSGSIAPYIEADWETLNNKLHVIPGLRLDSFVIDGDKTYITKEGTEQRGYLRNENVVEPRLTLRFQPTERLSFKVGYGQYHQAPQSEDLSPVFGNPNLSVARATHYLAGVQYRLFEKMPIELTVFRSDSNDLTARNYATSPLAGETLTNLGVGRAYGGQVLLRQELTHGFFGWLSYSYIRSERKLDENSSWRLFDYDQTHVATAVASYELPAGFELGLRLRYATGMPRTPVVSAYYNSRRDLYEPVFGKQNSIRIPAFAQADVRLSKRFKWNSGVKLELYADVQNITNRKNREDIVYNYNYTERNYISSLPTLAIVGGRLEW